ncbi:MAG: aconitate hydratase, partial [Elusimicrobia bacterium]|nr:aconitate hydratase [Elusimicrobiota bacterium]
NTSLTISPGSRQVFSMLASSGKLFNIINAGARILECACGPCIGMGQAPKTKAVSLRTFNRNFEGRSGTKDAQVYLCSPEVALAAALTGEITDPTTLFGAKPKISLPDSFYINDDHFQKPSNEGEIVRGPNIKPLPKFEPMPDSISADVVLKVGDNISTDHILPAGAKILPLRSNLPAISEHTFGAVDKDFVARAKSVKNGVIVGAENYGQGSSREHAALAPRYLGIKVVITKTFARIHLANLINFGIIPLTFADVNDYELIKLADKIEFKDIKNIIKENKDLVITVNGKNIKLNYSFTERQKEILFAGGLLNWIKEGIK